MKNNYYDARFKFDEGRTKVWTAICEYIQQNFINENGNILELGSGYCDFINNIKGTNKFALDIEEKSGDFKNEGVKFFHQSTTDSLSIPENYLDAVFASNLFEHLNDQQLKDTCQNINKHLKIGGKLILIQPNYKYCYKDYFDDYTHVKVFSHVSLADFLVSEGYSIQKSIPRFLPFSMKSKLPKSYLLTKLFINSPIRPGAKQMLIVATKNE